MASALVALGPALGGCGSGDEGAGPPTSRGTAPGGPASALPASAGELRGSAARRATTDDDVGMAVNASGSLGADLYRHLASVAGTGNLALSPVSIETALAMARVGATGETREELDRVLGAGPGDQLDHSLNALDAALASRSGRRGEGERTADVAVRAANSLWGQQGFSFRPPFLDALATDYGSGLQVVDFEHDTEGARRAINTWVADRTEQKISELLAPGVLDTATRLVLADALYLKAPWREPFEAQSGGRPFHRGDGSTVTAPTMLGGQGGRYGEGPGWRAAEVPYLGDELSMVLVAPDDLAAFERGLDGARLAQVTGGLRDDLASLQVPMFKVRAGFALVDALDALGVHRAFRDDAQFDAMSADRPLSIGAVEHQAVVTVDEQGTEAAAATGVTMGLTSAGPMGHALVVDRPFLFAVRDVRTGAVLFLGRVVDPTA